MAETSKPAQEDVARDRPHAAAASPASAPQPTAPKDGLASSEAAKRIAEFGPNTLEEKKKSDWDVLLGFFWGPIPWMIEAAALMALLVGDYGDFLIIASLLLFNAGLGFWEEHQASNALSALKNALARKARVLRDGTWSEIDATRIVPGDVVRIRLGDIVPADCTLAQGSFLSVDQSSLTGESLPVSKKVGDLVYSGSIAKQGEMVAVVTATGSKTFFGRTAKLVSTAGSVSHFQSAVMKVGDFLIALAAVLAIILVAVQLSREESFLRVAEFVLILLVASVPVAMPAVLSMTMALGAQMLARNKVIVSRLEAIEEMAGMDILCSDKTGTLTQNKLTLGEIKPWGNYDVQTILLAGTLASKAEDQDPIDLAVLAGLGDRNATAGYQVINFVPFDPVTKRTEATIRSPDGRTFSVSKGAPQVIFDLAKLTPSERKTAEEIVDIFAAKGFRTLGVAETDASGTWKLLGIVSMSDPPRPDSKATIGMAESLGISVKMVTGDNVAIASQIAGQLGLGTHIQPASELLSASIAKDGVTPALAEAIEKADGFAQVFPEHKYAIVKALQMRNHIVGMTGDGVNDAPALKQANVGIAVSGATDAARSAAALILTSPGLSVIIQGIEEARRIFRRMMSYTLYRIAMTIDIMAFIVLATIAYGFFPLTPVMIIALALLDDVPIMTIAFDNASASKKPVRWDMRQVMAVSIVLGILAVIQSFGLMYIGKTVLGVDTAQLKTMMFLQLVAGGHLMLFVTRSREEFWKPPHPANKLLWAIIGTQVFATLVCAFGWLVPVLSWRLIAIVWAYNLFWMLILDRAKLAIYEELQRRDEGRTPFLSRLKTPLNTGTPS
ncbi:plasma-membrane proton-efflux P-type ATPase [Hyphomicrobium sp.]|uniref:plasma-membrane proton-efflux P-type ATPase n=1 Tax=Hyphomicrobium sp. TaxID=82 RepID=UPI002E368D45|nr:plasma-membrane proton-efflux P-type ATPase [Hyphomicrobium sp.]HEX2842518.1 plasma-membrane proton-efflux P-type ATPase [Hyphomicrobium sp.]